MHSLRSGALARAARAPLVCPAVPPRWLSASTTVAAAASSSSPPLLYSLSLYRYPPAVQTSSHAAAHDSHRQRRLARLEPPTLVANRPQIAIGSVLLDQQRREAEDARIQEIARQKRRPQSSRQPTPYQSATSAANQAADAAAIDAVSAYHTHMLIKLVRYRRTDAKEQMRISGHDAGSAAWAPAGTAGDYDVAVATRVLSAADSLSTLAATVSSLLSASDPRAAVDSVRAASPFARFISRLRGRLPSDSAFTVPIDSARSIASLFAVPLPLKQSAVASPTGPIALRLRSEEALSGRASAPSVPPILLVNPDGVVHSGALPRHLLMRRLRWLLVVFAGAIVLLVASDALSERWLQDAQMESDRRTRLERQHALTEMQAQKRREDKREVVARGGVEMEAMRIKKEALKAKMEEAERIQAAREAEQRRKAGDAAAAGDHR